jgi:hypothetical protein
MDLQEVIKAILLRRCWYYHHRCSEDHKNNIFVILNVVKDLIKLIGKA